MTKRVTIFMVGALLIFSSAISYAKKKPHIFHPEMEPVKGEWSKPHMTVGEKPKTEWSEETKNAAVGKKPLGGKIIRRSGEIIDVSCYTQLGKHGKDHAGCAKSCIMNGHPVGLLDESGTVYLLFPEEHDSRKNGNNVLREALLHNVAEIVEVWGTLTNVKGTRAIYVQGFVKKVDQ